MTILTKSARAQVLGMLWAALSLPASPAWAQSVSPEDVAAVVPQAVATEETSAQTEPAQSVATTDPSAPQEPAGPYDPGFPFAEYASEGTGIYLKYPEGWHVWRTDSSEGQHLYITREPIDSTEDPYLAGIHLTQSSQQAMEQLSWIDFSNPKQAANQWLTALELSSEGQLKLLSAKKIPVGEMTGFFSAWLFTPPEVEGYPISTLRISVFGEHYFSEVLFECPAVEYEQLVPVFVGIIEDPAFRFQ